MAVLNTAITNPTLADLTSRMTKDGKIDPRIIEVLNETNEMLSDLVWNEATGVTENVTTVRSGLPSVAWRRLNYGVQPSKSKTKQISDSLGMLEAYAEVDKKLAMLNGNTEAWRASENAPFIEAMNQEFQRALLYGDCTKDPAKILGIMPRFCTGIKSKAENAVNVIDASEGGEVGKNLTSILLMTWGQNTMYCSYPKGLVGGLQHEDLGEVTLDDPEGGHYQGYRSHYEWNVGFTMRDWRYCVRIANIDVDKLTTYPTSIDLRKYMIRAMNLLPSMNGGRMAWYCNRTIKTYFEQQLENKSNVWLTLDQAQGREVTKFRGIPIRRVDAMMVGEAKVPFS